MATVATGIPFTRHAARRGTSWLVQSYAMFARHRLAWIVLLLGYYAVLVLVELVPWIGTLLAPIIKPLLSVAFLAAAWEQERGGTPALRMLSRGFRANVGALLPLGIVFIAGISIALAATALIDGGALLDLFYGAAPAADDDPAAAARHVQQTLATPRVQLAMLFGALCALPTLLALWWAPALVVFQDASLVTALSTSLRAAVANWRAALRYGAGLFVMGGVVPTVIMTMLAAFVPPPLNATLAAVIVLPYVAFFVATLHISDYVSYRDVFHADERSGSDSQRPGSDSNHSATAE